MPTGRITLPDGVVRRAFGEEVILLNLATGRYHGLNAMGGHMLDLLEASGNAATTAATVAEQYAVPLATVRQDLAELCRRLRDEGLIVVAER